MRAAISQTIPKADNALRKPCTQPYWHLTPSRSPPPRPTPTATNSALTADAPIWVALFPTMPLPDRTPPLSGMNPHAHGARKCHTSWGQTPQLNKANATAEQSKCHRSRSSKCGVCPHEVRHSGH